MIRSVADLLAEVLESELPKLDANPVVHAPTIGDMYEGLSSDLLSQALPSDLSVTTGFVTDGRGNRSGQLDCIIARGVGEVIPYTNSFVHHVRDVVAVVEVKKTLHKTQLGEAWSQLLAVQDIEKSDRAARTEEAPDEPLDLRSAERAFAETTRQAFPGYGETSQLSEDLRAIWRVLMIEQLSIVRIVLGLHGYQSEISFRKGMVEMLRGNVGVAGYGPRSMPQLIISGNYSLVKSNGRPYSVPVTEGWWPYCFSTPVNPLLILLELIWTRIGDMYDVTEFWGEDLNTEVARALLLGRGSDEGWEISFADPTVEELADIPTEADWTPAFLGDEEFVLVNQLCAGHAVQFDDPSLLSWLKEREVDAADIRANLLSTGLVAASGQELVLITRECLCAILPSGDRVAAENNTGRLTRWISKWMLEHAPTAGGSDG